MLRARKAISSVLQSRVKKPSLLEKIKRAEDLIDLFPNGAAIGWSGFTGVGYPKVVPIALADHVEKNNLQGELRYELYCGASSGLKLERRWAQLDMISRRSCAIHGPEIAKAVNNAQINFFDRHVSMFPQELQYGFYTLDKPNNKLDVAIIEASAITEDGEIVLGPAAGSTPEILQMAEKVIIEINATGPSFEGLHDIVTVELPPNRKPFMVLKSETVSDHPISLSIHQKLLQWLSPTKKCHHTYQAN